MLKSRMHQKRRLCLNIVLCDDNLTFLNNFKQQLQSIAAELDWLCQFTVYHSSTHLLDADLSVADLLFLDIDMPGMNGIDVGKKLREKYPELIIVFVTGFIQYARDGYSVAAFRYLLKDSLHEELLDCLRDIQRKLYESQETIIIRGLEDPVKYRLQDIIYFEGTARRHALLHTKHDVLECLGKLSDYETQLENRGFLRIQRSFLVNMVHIEWIKNYHVVLSNGERLKISERNNARLTEQYLNWKGKRL